LRELGYDEAEVAAFQADGVVGARDDAAGSADGRPGNEGSAR
jgi:hypothetical protein